jgi:D-aminopeptidase
VIPGYGALVQGRGPVRTGVTAVRPRGRTGTVDPAQADWFSFNGSGQMTGTTLLDETGLLSTPILITKTHSVRAVHTGAAKWPTVRHPGLANLWA